MNIGFDFDKIFVNYPPFVPSDFIEKLYKLKENGILLYRLPSPLEQKLRIISHYHFFRPPLTHNIAFLRTLVTNKKNNYYLISSRFSFLKNKTTAILKKYKLENTFTEVFFNFSDQQPHLFKDTLIKKKHIDRYVDDDLSLLKYVAARNPATKFFWLNKEKKIRLEKNLWGITHIEEMLE